MKFHRAIGEFAGQSLLGHRRALTAEEYAKHLAEALPTEEEKQFVLRLMREPDWLAPRD